MLCRMIRVRSPLLARQLAPLAVASILALAGFAVIFLPWDDRQALLTWMRPMLVGSTIGGFIGGLLLHRHFGAPRWRGLFHSALAYSAAVVVGGAVGSVIAQPHVGSEPPRNLA